MKKTCHLMALALMIFFCLQASDGRQQGQQIPSGRATIASAPQLRLDADFGRMPLQFIPNQGQMDGRVAYYVQGRDKTIYFTSEGLTFVLANHARVEGPEPERPQRWVVKLDFVGSNADVKPVGLEKSGAVISYFKGKPEEWKAGLAAFSKIIYRDLWPGIDLIYYGTLNRMKYEFIVHPGADPSRIKLAYLGASRVALTSDGRIEVETPPGNFKDEIPVAYQEVDGRQMDVAVSYVLEEPKVIKNSPSSYDPLNIPNLRPDSTRHVYGFDVEAYDRSRTLVLDPAVLVYCGYVGGIGTDAAYGIAIDGFGNAYITGATNSAELGFPELVGPDLTYNDDGSYYDAFIAKINASGTVLLYCGYIGGSRRDIGYGIAVDGLGNAYITGETSSSESSFPVIGGPDLTYNGGSSTGDQSDAFVAKVDASGTELDFCGYIGGSTDDYGRGVAVDSLENAYVTGWTSSNQTTFPVKVGPDITFNSYSGNVPDAFIAKIDNSGFIVYCGYIGGYYGDEGFGVAVDNSGNAYVTGETSSSQSTFPATVGPDLTYDGGGWSNAFVAKVNPSGTSLDYCGYIGGQGPEHGYAIAVDASGNAYVAGETARPASAYLPVVVGPDLTFNGAVDAFVAKVNSSGTAFVYCGYIGGSSNDSAWGIAVDQSGNAFVSGRTGSTQDTFPVLRGPDLTFNGGEDAFVAKVNASGTALVYCGYLGGPGIDEGGYGIAVDGSGKAYVAGVTAATEATFPVVAGPDLTYNGGSFDAFLAKIEEVRDPTPILTSLSPSDAIAYDQAFTLVVTGSAFVDGAVVCWDGVNRPTTFISSTQLNVSVGAGDLLVGKAVQITAQNPESEISNSLEFVIYNPVPSLGSLAPASARVGDPEFTLTMMGSLFVDGAILIWDGSERPTTFIGMSQISAAIGTADLTSSRTVQVTVRNPGSTASNPLYFTINEPLPILTSLVPSSAYAGGPGFNMSVIGSKFINGAIVRWDGNDRPTTFVNSYEVDATIGIADIASAKSVQVTVQNPDGGISNSLEFTIGYSVPSLLSLLPPSARAGGPGLTLTVTGSDFVDGAVVKWGGTNRATTFISSSAVSAEISANDLAVPMTVQITVSNPGTENSNALEFLVDNPLPTLTSLAPAGADAGNPGFTLSAIGSHFVSGAVVVWDGNDRPTTYVNDTRVQAIIGTADLSAVRTVQVSVRNPDGGVSNALGFVVSEPPAPLLTSVSPTKITGGGAGFDLTLFGTNFVTNSVAKWNGINKTTTYVSSTELRAAIPAGDISVGREVQVTVTNPIPAGSTSNPLIFPVSSFTVTSSPTRATVTAGQSAAYAIQVTPQYGSFDSPISFTSTGLPRGCVASISPGSVTPGYNVVSVALNLSTTGNLSATSLARLGSGGGISPTLGLLIATLALAGWVIIGRLYSKRTALRWLTAVALICVIGMIAGCGAGGGNNPPSNNGTPAGTYEITVNGQSGSMTATTVVTLVVR